jgi:hypothetical protein
VPLYEIQRKKRIAENNAILEGLLGKSCGQESTTKVRQQSGSQHKAPATAKKATLYNDTIDSENTKRTTRQSAQGSLGKCTCASGAISRH